MKRLLELQKQEEDSRLSGRPMTLAAPSDQLSIETRGHGYYNSFRTKSREQRTGAAEAGERPLGTAPGHAPRPVRTVGSDASRLSAAAPHTRTGGANTGAVGTDAGAGAAPRGSGPNSGARARISPDDIYENARRRTEQQKAEEEKRRALDEKRKRENAAARAAEKKTYESPHANVGTPGQAVDGAGQSARGRSAGSARNARGVNGGASFEQTEADKRRERAAKQEALEKAKRARRLRKIRDAVISFVLILAVFAVMCIVVYRLLFVISDISVDGSENYSADEIIAASGVKSGDNLYSFSSRTAERLMKKKCPYVKSLKVERAIPNRIKFTVEEEKAEFAPQCEAAGLDLISMIAPTSHDRIKMIAAEAKGFVYCVSSLGVTGVRSEITTDIGAMVRLVKEANPDVSCAVGFGISTPEQAAKMAAVSDGAIVGSAIVRLCAKYGCDAVKPIADYVHSMKEAIMQ